MHATRRSFLAAAGGSAIAFAGAAKSDAPARPRFIVAALTMLDRRGKFDDAMNKDYLAFLSNGGADGILALGTTGEFPSFSVRERKLILESVVKHKGRLALMAHVGTGNVPETIELMDHATHAGAESVLVIPPYYFKNPTVEGLANFYEPILKAAKLPVLLYNIPQNSGSPITPELLRRLAPFEQLYGIKDSFSKADVMLSFIKDFPKLKIITGVPANMETNLKEGGAGAITGNGSVYVKETAAIFAAHRAGGDVHAAQSKFNEASKLMGGYDSIPAQKFVLSKMGLRESASRPPFLELTAEKKQELVDKLHLKG